MQWEANFIASAVPNVACAIEAIHVIPQLDSIGTGSHNSRALLPVVRKVGIYLDIG